MSININPIETYVPTIYVNNSEPDLDETNLNHAEQALKRVTDAANAAILALESLDSAKIDAAKIVNNLLATDTSTVLSGPMGKALGDRLTAAENLLTRLNSDNFSTYRSFIGLDFNTIEKTGIYSDGSTPDTSGCKNYPVNITGLLFVLRTQYVCAQIYFTNDMTSLHVRARYLSNVWSGWRAFSLA